MDYKKFRDVNAWLYFIGTELSAVLSIVMMFFPEKSVSINFMPFMLFSVIASARTVWLTSQKDYNAEEYVRSASEPVLNEDHGKGKALLVIQLISGCLIIVLSVIKIIMR